MIMLSHMASNHSRRTILKGLMAATVGGGVLGGVPSAAASTQQASANGTLEKIGHTYPETLEQDGGVSSYAMGSLNPAGDLAAVSSRGDVGGSLFDVSDAGNIEELHTVQNPSGSYANDVKFDTDRDVYYLAHELRSGDGFPGFQVVDYGWDTGTPEDPVVVGEFEAPNTGVHKVEVHPDEPIVYATDKGLEQPGLMIIDVSDPANPTHVDEDNPLRGPEGYLHDMEVELSRDVLYGAYAIGNNMGIAIWDIADPSSPDLLAFVDYDDRPNYEEIGTPGYQICHQVNYDPDRDLIVAGDELGGGAFGQTPGGKHVWDVGWGEGSLEDPEHIGFTHSPNAMELFGYTTHFHDIIPESHTSDGSTILVDGGYNEGVWLCDITDPTDPTPAEQYPTIDGIENINPHPASAWGAEYSMSEEFVLATDSGTGIYTFEVNDEPFEFRTPLEEVRQTFEPEDELDLQSVRLAVAYWRAHDSVPNTGGTEMTTSQLRTIVDAWRS